MRLLKWRLAPSLSQHDGEVARLGSEYGISVEHVTLGSPTQIAPIAIDLLDDFMTTPLPAGERA